MAILICVALSFVGLIINKKYRVYFLFVLIGILLNIVSKIFEYNYNSVITLVLLRTSRWILLCVPIVLLMLHKWNDNRSYLSVVYVMIFLGGLLLVSTSFFQNDVLEYSVKLIVFLLSCVVYCVYMHRRCLSFIIGFVMFVVEILRSCGSLTINSIAKYNSDSVIDAINGVSVVFSILDYLFFVGVIVLTISTFFSSIRNRDEVI